MACFRLCAHRKQWGVLLLLTCMLSASLWFGIVWHVPNTHDREYHHTVWEFLVGNSDVLLLLAVLAVVLLAFATNGDASAEANAGTILTSK